MAKRRILVGAGIEEQIGNTPYIYTDLTLDDLSGFMLDGTSTIKPKRKYVRKAVIASDEAYNKDLKDIIRRLELRTSISSHKTRITRKIVEDYFSCVIKYLNPTINFKVHVEQLDNPHNYIAWKIKILVAKNIEKSYSDSTFDFSIEELQSNCSSVGIHHFNGQFIKNNESYGNEQLFTKQEQADKFIQSAVDLCKIFGYTNILYTISQESNKGLASYVEKNAKEILEFKSKRNQHIIKYYSQLI